MTMQLPPLPPLNSQLYLTQLMRGPTIYSNWVIPGVVMVGAYPGAFEDEENDRILKLLLHLGVDTFVCLQAEFAIDTPEEMWRNGQGLRPYILDAQRLSDKQINWAHLPVVDMDVTEDDHVAELVEHVLRDIRAGRVPYVHCWGGHGRAGIIVCLLLARLYGLSAKETLCRIQRYHDCRVDPQGVRSPSTVSQRNQVKRILQKWLDDSVYIAAPDSTVAPKKSASHRSALPMIGTGKTHSIFDGLPPPSRERTNGERGVQRNRATKPANPATTAAAQNGRQRRQSRGPGTSGIDIRQQVVSIYKAHCPTKVGDVDRVMEKFKGRESELLTKVRRKYTGGQRKILLQK